MGLNLPARGTAPRILVGVLAVAASVLVRLAFQDMLGPRTPFVTFYPAAMIAALCGGLVSGLIATAGMGLIAYLWVLPQLAPYILDSAAWLALGMFLFSGALVAAIAEALHRVRVRAAESEIQAALAAERVRMDAALQHLAAIVESSDDAIIGSTLDGFITSWNQGAQRIYGYSAEEAVGRSASMLCPPGQASEIPGFLARIAAGEVVRHYETTRRRKDGSLVPVSVTLSPIRGIDRSVTGISAVVRDITERKRTEEALRQNEQRLLFSQEIAMIGQWELDLASNTLSWCPGVYRIFERDPATFPASYEAFLALVHPEDRDAVDRAYAESLAARRPYSIVHRLRLPNGRVKWVKEACRHELGADGNPLRSLGIVQDITELKLAEEARRESEAISGAIIAASPDCIKLLNHRGELAFMSPGGLVLLELDSAEPLLGRPYLEFWKGSDFESAAAAFHEAQSGRLGRFEGFCPTARGTPKWWDVSISPMYGSPMRDAEARIDRYLVVSRDITERKLASDALRIERERLSAIIDTTQDLMFLKDPELRYLAANAAHEAVLGLAPRDMIGKTDLDLLPPDLAASCRESDLAALRDGSVMLEEKVGDTWFQISKRRVEDAFGMVLGVAALITDITTRKRAYEALRESEELFRQLVESAPDAIFVQTKGCFAYANKACLKLYGAPGMEALLGTPVLSRFHPDYHARAAERIRKLNEERQAQPPMEQRHLCLDGSVVDVEVSGVPLVYGGENGALVFVHDITERKRVEVLREDMERIARHDLKGPLNAVINLPLLFQDDPNLGPEQVEGLRLIHQAGLRMLEQIDQSLTLYRIETGSFELTPQPVDLAELTGQVAGELAALAQGLGVELRVKTGRAIVSGDGLLCRTMLSNLLKNAMEAAPRGGLVQVRLAAQGGWAEWSVHNDGAVPKAHRARFFDKYFTSGKSRGAGLGTYSARLSAEAQGGAIALRTSEAEGTEVIVRLPLWPEYT